MKLDLLFCHSLVTAIVGSSEAREVTTNFDPALLARLLRPPLVEKSNIPSSVLKGLSNIIYGHRSVASLRQGMRNNWNGCSNCWRIRSSREKRILPKCYLLLLYSVPSTIDIIPGLRCWRIRPNVRIFPLASATEKEAIDRLSTDCNTGKKLLP